MIVLDESCAPVWIVRLAGRVTGRDLEQLSRFVSKMHQASISTLLVDALEARVPEASIRTGLGQMTNDQELEGRGKTVAVAVMLPPGILSGAVRAILWFAPNLEEGLVKVVPDHSAALEHLQTRLPENISSTLRRRVEKMLSSPVPLEAQES